MDEKLEEMVNSLQRNAALKSAREIEKVRHINRDMLLE